jgi:hypothetical protein
VNATCGFGGREGVHADTFAYNKGFVLFVGRLEQQVQQQQQLLDGLAADLQQHSSSSSSSGWRAAGVRQQMMQRLQRWKAGGQVSRGQEG